MLSQRLLDCHREAKFKIFSKSQKAQLKGLDPRQKNK